MGRQRRSRTKFTTLDRPDVTPLVDLTFLLLIVFMITAPALEYSLDIDPPDLNATTVVPSEHNLISIDKNGKLFMDTVPVDRDQMVRNLSQSYAQKRPIQVFIRADKQRPYGEVIEVMKLIQNIGINDVSLLTRAER